MELGVLGHLGLDEECRVLRVEAGPEPVRQHLHRVARDRGGIRVVGEGVPVRDEVVAVVRVLKLHPVVERPEVVPQVDLQDAYDCYYFVAKWHALTDDTDTDRKSTRLNSSH